MSAHASLLAPATLAQAREHGLTPAEFDVILARLGRPPNLVELGVFGAMWSEHCSYKSTRRHLKGLPTSGPQVIQGPGENAGVVAIGPGPDGEPLAAVFKMESHNHPSFIEPYQGAATGVGGILRDVFTMGARPVALVNALRFGEPGHPRTRELVAGVVAGIGGYGNCVGVPTVGGETNFHPGYNGNILVNAMAVGIAPAAKIFYARGAKPGSPVVYVGAKTGRDGIKGAVMASAEFGAGSQADRPTVQVGDPFKEKLLIEACLELMAGDAIEAVQDMGAAGLTSSSVEMAGKGGLGVEIDLDHIPVRETAMTAYEIMLSESQERMLMILKPGREEEARAIFAKWELDAAVIGATTTTGRLVLRHHGAVVCDIPVAPLSQDAPNYDRPWTPPAKPAVVSSADLPEPGDLTAALLALMGCPDLASKRWIWEKYDRTVMADTVDSSQSGGDAAVVRIHGTSRGLAIASDCTPRYVAADPYEGAKQAVAEAYRNLSAVGAKPLAVTDNLNFGNPEKPAIMGQIVEALRGMAEACRALDMPIVSGNVSLYNETSGRAIPPTPVVGAVGLIEDLAKRATIGGLADGDQLFDVYVPGQPDDWLGASLYLREVLGREEGAPPPVDLDAERRAGAFIREAIALELTTTVHDISDGGWACALVEMALASDIGVSAYLGLADPDEPERPTSDSDGRALAARLFGEGQARYILALRLPRHVQRTHPAKAREQEEALRALASAHGVAVRACGWAQRWPNPERYPGEDMVRIARDAADLVEDDDFEPGDDLIRQPLRVLREVYEGWMPNFMQRDA